MQIPSFALLRVAIKYLQTLSHCLFTYRRGTVVLHVSKKRRSSKRAGSNPDHGPRRGRACSQSKSLFMLNMSFEKKALFSSVLVSSWVKSDLYFCKVSTVGFCCLILNLLLMISYDFISFVLKSFMFLISSSLFAYYIQGSCPLHLQYSLYILLLYIFLVMIVQYLRVWNKISDLKNKKN